MTDVPVEQEESSADTYSTDDLRQMGNHEFVNKNYDNAVALYTQALASCDRVDESSDGGTEDASTKLKQKLLNLCNRSACYYIMEKYEEAYEDALASWKMESSIDNIKAAYRLAKTELSLGFYTDAQSTLKEALATFPTKEEKIGETKKTNEKKDNDTDEEENKAKAQLQKSRKAFEDLLIQAYVGPTIREPIKPESLKWAQRLVSIREFKKLKELGYGNFSEIHEVVHIKTNEKFALKCIVKKKAEDLAKRQHPNVYNEIAMERRILMERLPPFCPNIVKMYHSFEDYNTIYYLMDLHEECGDLWSQIRYAKKKMVGCHYSQIQIWMLQIIDALEYIHKNGMVHRDLKPENILLNRFGDIVIIDFGTAKDLIKTDLNGPEFVGTPDFMSPEAVTGTGEMPKLDNPKAAWDGADCSTDLWALGAIAFILHTGETPFWSPSPYLAFLKIKRCELKRPWGIADDDAWDFISSLMQKDPKDRLCFDAYTVTNDGAAKNDEKKISNKVKVSGGGYDGLRNHPYFSHGRDQIENKNKHTLIPSLQDLCIRACGDLVLKDSTDVEVCDNHPPGDKSAHDFATRLDQREKHLILHFLDKRKVLTGVDAIRLYERFFVDIISCRLDAKIRVGTHDYIGYTQMNDDMGKPPSAMNEDPYAKKMIMDPLRIAHLTNPMLTLSRAEQEQLDDATRKKYTKLFKKCIVAINRDRPKLVVVCGVISDKFRKLLCKISDSIPIAFSDSTSDLPNSTYFSFWHSGTQCIFLQSKDLLMLEGTKKKEYNQSSQMIWLREMLEQCSMAKHPLFLYIDCDPRKLPNSLLQRIARGKVQALSGLSTDETFQMKYYYEPITKEDNGDNDDDISIRSTDSEENEKDVHCMKITGSKENALSWVTIDTEQGEWVDSEFTTIELPSK